MKIVVSSKELKSKLAIVQGLNNNASLPVLDNLLLGSNGANTIVATDLTTSIRENVVVTEVLEKGIVAIPRKKFYEIAGSLEGDVKITSEQNNRVLVQSGSSEFKVAGVNPEDYPAFPEVKSDVSIVVDAHKLAKLIEESIYCTASDSQSPMSALLLHIKPGDNNIRMIGTDGHRMAAVKTNVDLTTDKELKLLIPKESALKLKQFLSTEADDSRVVMSIGDNNISYKSELREIVIRLMAGKYPDYVTIISGIEAKRVVTVIRKDLIAALRRMLVVSKEESNAVKLEISSGVLTISTYTQEAGEAKDELRVEYTGKEFSIGFNGKYILDALNAVDTDKVIFTFQDKLKVAAMQCEGREDFRYIMMPMRLKK